MNRKAVAVVNPYHNRSAAILWGGPSHGLWVDTDSGRRHYFRCPQSDGGVFVYLIHCFLEIGERPLRRRSIYYGLPEGEQLNKRDENGLWVVLSEIPWEFPRASILYQFEDWWTATLYRLTGRLQWRGQEIEETEYRLNGKRETFRRRIGEHGGWIRDATVRSN